jgi:hypothetical protein
MSMTFLAMTKKRELVETNREAILKLAKLYGLERVRLFGSVARGDEEVGSDIDLIVSRRSGDDPWKVLDFEDEVKKLLQCEIDILIEHSHMRESLRREIFRDAVPV